MQATLTVLFTDAVASTEALARLGDERFGVVQRAHLDALRECVVGCDGREVKNLGDGLMVVFTGAADALACAVAMQQAVELVERRGEDGLPLRVGVALGDVTIDDDGDCQGTAVVEAARLCAAAAAGQVLATETVRAVAGSRGGHAYTSLGPLELKGLPEPVAVTEVGWAPVAQEGGLAPVPLPPRLAFESAWAFVGRASEVERLDGLWRQVVGGVRVALLGGEPGAGKTRLAQEMAARAHEQGALVLFGRVDEDLAVAYQPFAEALRHYLASVDEATRERVLGLRGGALARLVPELVEEPPQGQGEALAIFEGLVDWLSMEAAQRPVVLVLDDVHWAAKPTLQALMHLVRSSRLSRLLIVATYRDTELDRTHPLAGVLADLRREEGVERLAVRGLDADGVAAFVQAARGDVLDDAARELVELLSEQTQGNPFFVGQVLRHLSETGAVEEVDGRWVRAEGNDEFVVPEGVRDVVGRRVSRLSQQAGELLTVAAVTGPQFDVATVAEVVGQPMSEALDSLDEALAARLVLETGSPGQLRFAHALVRQTLEDELSTLRRLHLHQQIGLALERRFGDAESVVADLAHHFGEAAAVGEGERAARYAERAAVKAVGRGAVVQAADLLDRALEGLPPEADPDGRWRGELYTQLVTCCQVAQDSTRMERASRRWLALGETLNDDAVRLEAMTWIIGSHFARARPDAADLERLALALSVDVERLDLRGRRRLTFHDGWCASDATGIRAWALSQIAWSWGVGVPLDGVRDRLPADTPVGLSDEACRLAAESRDPYIADAVLDARGFALFASPDSDALLAAGQRAATRGFTHGGGGAAQVAFAFMRLGRLDELAALTREMDQVGRERGDQSTIALADVWRALEALARGRLDEARVATERMLETLPQEAGWQLVREVLTCFRLLAEGRPDDARVPAEMLSASPIYDYSHVRAVVAIAQGDLDPAHAVLADWRAGGASMPLGMAWSARAWGLAECAHATGDRAAAEQLYPVLVPYDGQFLDGLGVCITASAGYTLGLLAETLADHDRARAHYADALTFEESCGAETLAARTRQALAGIS